MRLAAEAPATPCSSESLRIGTGVTLEDPLDRGQPLGLTGGGLGEGTVGGWTTCSRSGETSAL